MISTEEAILIGLFFRNLNEEKKPTCIDRRTNNEYVTALCRYDVYTRFYFSFKNQVHFILFRKKNQFFNVFIYLE